MPTWEQVIVDIWKRTGSDVAGAFELDSIQKAVAEQLVADPKISPAIIARTLADHGVRLGHPEVLQADARWREHRQLFTPEELNFGTLEAATALINKIESLRSQFEQAADLREVVREIKNEVELLTASERVPEKSRQLGREVAQWLTVWLQNPQIFSQWLDLRRSTPEFSHRFSRINTDGQNDPC